MILTDEEIMTIFRNNDDPVAVAHAIEARVLDELRKQEPVAWKFKASGQLVSAEALKQPFNWSPISHWIPLYAAPTPPAEQKPVETAWLVEWKDHGHGPQWWGFRHKPTKYADFCSDTNNAIRFSRKEDAERMVLHIIDVAGLTGNTAYSRGFSATEHQWIGTNAALIPPEGSKP